MIFHWRQVGGVAQTASRAGLHPTSAIDTEAGWSTSGWQCPIAVTVRSVWIPLDAELTVSNRGDNEVAPWLVRHLLGAV